MLKSPHLVVLAVTQPDSFQANLLVFVGELKLRECFPCEGFLVFSEVLGSYWIIAELLKFHFDGRVELLRQEGHLLEYTVSLCLHRLDIVHHRGKPSELSFHLFILRACRTLLRLYALLFSRGLLTCELSSCHRLKSSLQVVRALLELLDQVSVYCHCKCLTLPELEQGIEAPHQEFLGILLMLLRGHNLLVEPWRKARVDEQAIVEFLLRLWL